jgi:hypothetical protein
LYRNYQKREQGKHQVYLKMLEAEKSEAVGAESSNRKAETRLVRNM